MSRQTGRLVRSPSLQLCEGRKSPTTPRKSERRPRNENTCKEHLQGTRPKVRNTQGAQVILARKEHGPPDLVLATKRTHHATQQQEKHVVTCRG